MVLRTADESVLNIVTQKTKKITRLKKADKKFVAQKILGAHLFLRVNFSCLPCGLKGKDVHFRP
jgi:hypothetical protein